MIFNQHNELKYPTLTTEKQVTFEEPIDSENIYLHCYFKRN